MARSEVAPHEVEWLLNSVADKVVEEGATRVSIRVDAMHKDIRRCNRRCRR